MSSSGVSGVHLSSWALDLGRPRALEFKPRSNTFGPVAVSEKKPPHTHSNCDRKRKRDSNPRWGVSQGKVGKVGDGSGHCPDTSPGGRKN